jgi:transcription initiation factor TFIID subunit 12
MNQGQGQGMAGQANAQNLQAKPPAAGAGVPGAGAQGRPQGPQLFRPEDMRNMFFLTEDERTKYERGLSQLWKLHDSATPGSSEQLAAKQKLIDFGKILTAKLHQRQQQQQQAQQQQLQAQQQQQGQGQPQPQQPQQPQQNAAAAGNANNAPRPAQAPQQNPQAKPLPAHIVNHVNEQQFQVPANVQDKAKFLEDLKTKYAKALLAIETNRNVVKVLDRALNENPNLTPEERKRHEERKALAARHYNDAAKFANQVRQQYIVGGGQRPSQDATAGENAATPANTQVAQGAATQALNQGVNNAGGALASPANPMHSSAAAVNAAFEAARKQQLAAGRIPGAVNALSAQQVPTTSLPQAQPVQAQISATQAPAQPSPVTQVSAQQQSVGGAQPQVQPTQKPIQQQPAAPVKLEPTMPSVPTPINTAIAAAAAAGVPSAGTPTQNSARIQTPHSATPTVANSNIRPLSHADAVTKASQSVPGATGLAGQPSAGPGPAPGVNMGPGQQIPQSHPQHGHPHAHPAQGQQAATAAALHSKLPIPKTLPEKAVQVPTPVPNIGGISSTSRPTFTGGSGTAGGVLNQPVLAKTPAYQLEGEGERVLNKKKLDELVRMVCGGTAEGQEGNLLTPEVEEVSSLLSSIVLRVKS